MEFPINIFNYLGNMANCVIKLFNYWNENIYTVINDSTDNWMINTATKVGMLRWGSLLKKQKIRARRRKGRLQPTVWHRNYYVTCSTIKGHI